MRFSSGSSFSRATGCIATDPPPGGICSRRCRKPHRRGMNRIAVEPPNVTQDCKARAVRAPHVPHAPAASPRRAPFRRWLASRPVRVGGACLPPVTSSSSRADVAESTSRDPVRRCSGLCSGPARCGPVREGSEMPCSPVSQKQSGKSVRSTRHLRCRDLPPATSATSPGPTCPNPQAATRSRLAARASQCGPGWCSASDRVQAHWPAERHGLGRIAWRGIKYGLTGIRAGPGPGHLVRGPPPLKSNWVKKESGANRSVTALIPQCRPAVSRPCWHALLGTGRGCRAGVARIGETIGCLWACPHLDELGAENAMSGHPIVR